MENKISTLQDAINKRAAERLDADLKAISKTIRENRLLNPTSSGFPLLTYNMDREDGHEKVHQETKTPFWAFQYEASQYGLKSSVYMDQVRRYWLAVYIEEETQAFIEQVTAMQHDADQLATEQED